MTDLICQFGSWLLSTSETESVILEELASDSFSTDIVGADRQTLATGRAVAAEDIYRLANSYQTIIAVVANRDVYHAGNYLVTPICRDDSLNGVETAHQITIYNDTTEQSCLLTARQRALYECLSSDRANDCPVLVRLSERTDELHSPVNWILANSKDWYSELLSGKHQPLAEDHNQDHR